MGFRLDIQGLRALAVILVIIFHFNKNWLPGGYVGVDMFFVISGYLISAGVLKKLAHQKFNFWEFSLGRIKRIAPAYYVMLIFCGLCAALWFIPNDFYKFYPQFLRSILFVSNSAFSGTDGYFGTKSFENPLLHTWSLSIEMQFYLILPLILMITPKKFGKYVFILILAIGLIYTQYQITFLGRKADMYFSLLARSMEFLFGVLLNYIPKSSQFKISRSGKNFGAILALLTILISSVFLHEGSQFPGMMAVPTCLAAALIIWLNDSDVNIGISNPVFVFIGKLSYSLYLWHWPFFACYRYLYSFYEINFVRAAVVFICFFIASLLSYYIIEEGFRKMSDKKFLVLFTLLGIGVCSILVLGNRYKARQDIIPEAYVKSSGHDLYNHNSFVGEKLYGDTLAPNAHILLVGDSHALIGKTFLNQVGANFGFNFYSISLDSYPPLPNIDKSLMDEKTKGRYETMLPITKDLMREAEIIVIVRQWNRDDYDFVSVLDGILAEVGESKHIIVVTDFPRLQKNPLRRHYSLVKPDNFQADEVLFPVIPEAVLAKIKNTKNLHLLDIRDKLFFKQAPYYQDTIMYYDESHLNRYGSVKYAEVAGLKFDSLLTTIRGIIK